MVSQPVSSIVLCSLLSLWDLGLGELKACSFPDAVSYTHLTLPTKLSV